MAELLDTRLVVLVGIQQHGYDRAGVDENLAGQEPPNPAKCRGFVLRSRTFPLAAPINPAFFA